MADENLISLQPGTVIAGRYEVVKCLGAGSMGLVYACRHRELSGHLVAIKVLFPEVAQDAVAAARFRNEIVASYGVSHPHVVRAYEYFRDGDLVAYTMEYVGGGDLADRLSGGEPMPISEIVRIFGQVATGVQAIHDAGIVHRDLKPENILLTPQGDVKITDFGIARTGHGPKLTEHGGVVGTIDYVSPEYLEKGIVDARSDIYALGVLGFEMITGESPFRGDSVIATMTLRLRSDPKPPSSLRPDCPEGLDTVILKALERSPELRYQSAADIFFDLQSLNLLDVTGKTSSAYLYAGRSISQRETKRETIDLPRMSTRQPELSAMPASSVMPDKAGPEVESEQVVKHEPKVHSVSVSPPASGFKRVRSQAESAGITRIGTASQDEDETIHEPLRMESVLSSGSASGQSAPYQIRVGQGGLDGSRIRTLSQSIGDFQRSSWVVDALMVFCAVLLAFGVGLFALNYLWPDLFRGHEQVPNGYDITIFDDDFQP